MIRIRRTVLGSVRIRDGVAVAVCQARYVSVDSLFPAGPTLIAPAPCVVRQEAMRALGAFGVGYGRRPARVDAVAPGSFGERGTLPRQGRAGQVCIDTGGPLGNESLFAHGEINFGKRGDGIGGCIARSGGLLLGLRLLGGGDTSLLLGTSGLLRGDASSFFLGFDSFVPCEMSRDAVLVSTVDSRVEPSDTLAKSAESAMATFASAPPMPKESISCTAPLPAEANPKPMHPVSTHDAQPTAIILAARFDFFCI